MVSISFLLSYLTSTANERSYTGVVVRGQASMDVDLYITQDKLLLTDSPTYISYQATVTDDCIANLAITNFVNITYSSAPHSIVCTSRIHK